jgi:hypothetical protein
MNAVTLTGNIKNIVVKKEGQIVTANISQRGSDGKCITTMPLVFIGTKTTLPQDISEDKVIQITGKLGTRFDRRPGIENDKRFKPFTQIQVEELTIVSA